MQCNVPQLVSEAREENIFEMTQMEDWPVWYQVILIIILTLLGIFLLSAFLHVTVKTCSHIWTWYLEPTTPLTQSEESQADVFSISLPADITELPSYEESRKYPGTMKPPGYWTIFPYKIYYDQPVITVTL